MEEIVMNFLGYPGHLLSMSKSGYRDSHPDNLVVFNGNICVGTEKVWFGDIDVTLSKDTLFDLSKELNDVVYVLTEMDGRFGNEEEPKIQNFMAKFNPDGTYELHPRLKEHFTL